MIQVKCPKCREVVQLDDDQAGGVGSCTECGQKFRVPTPKQTSPVRPRPAAAPARKAAQPEEEDEEEILAEVDEEEDEEDEEAPAKPKKRKARRPADEDEEEDEDEEDRPRRRRRGRRRRVKKWSGELIPGISNTATAFLGLVVLWLAMAGVAFLPVPVVSDLAIGGLALLGLVLILVGRLWVLVLAFRDSGQTGMMCLFFPLYTLRFVAENQEDAGPPYLLFIIGVSMILSAIGIAYLHSGGG
jgi:hypothetical protein